MSCSGTVPVGPAEVPKMTRRPRGTSDAIAAPVKPPPSGSNTTVGRKPRTWAARSSAVPPTTSLAPRARSRSASLGALAWAQTVAPIRCTSETMMEPTPPPAPITSTRSLGVTWASSATVRHAVTPATPITAACRGSMPSGSSMSAERGTTTLVAQTPSRVVPTPWPKTATRRPSTVPVPSAPKVRGSGDVPSTEPAAR